MTDYTPTHEEAKNWYAHEAKTLELEFERFVRQVKADAWSEGHGQALANLAWPKEAQGNPYLGEVWAFPSVVKSWPIVGDE